MSIIGGSLSGKRNILLNLISHQPDVGKIYLQLKDPYEAKYQLLINKRKSSQYCYDPKAFYEYYSDIDIYENIDEYNPNKKRNLLIISDMIADML